MVVWFVPRGRTEDLVGIVCAADLAALSFRVGGLGFGVEGFFQIWGLGFGFWGLLGFGVQGLGL